MEWIDITEASQIPTGSPAVTIAWRHYSKRGRPAAEITINSRLRAQLGWEKGMPLRIQVAPDRSMLRLVPGNPGKKLGAPKRASAICHRLEWVESGPRSAERVPHRIDDGALILDLPDWARPAQGRAIRPAVPARAVIGTPVISPGPAIPPGPIVPPSAPAAAPAPSKWTPERRELLRKLWPDLDVTPAEILRQINALPGEPFAAPASLYDGAKRIGLPLSRYDAAALSNPKPATAPQPASTPTHSQTARATPHAPTTGAIISPANQAERIRREVEECMAAGMDARRIVDELGIGLNEVSNIIASIRAEQSRKRA